MLSPLFGVLQLPCGERMNYTSQFAVTQVQMGSPLQPTSAGYRKLVIGTQTRNISTGTISILTLTLIRLNSVNINKDKLKNAKEGNKMYVTKYLKVNFKCQDS